MKAFSALILVSIILSLSTITPPTLAYGEPSVGVKEGDWIEYSVSITGTGTPPPTHDVRWFKIEVLPVQGTAFSVNLTARYANGTLGSAIWEFNFTEGNVEGWIIIPSNLGPGDTFYDYSIHTGNPVNVTIQSQEQKAVLGASRTVTYGNDSLRHKEWDKATGVFVGSSEVYRNVTNRYGWYIENLTVTVQAIATNMWSPQIRGIDQTMFYSLVAVSIMLAALTLSSAVVVARRKKTRKGKTGALEVLVVLLLAVEAFVVTSLLWSEFGWGAAGINLIMQTFWTALVVASMWFRRKGNYFLHGIIMIVVVGATLVSFSAVLLMSPPSGGSMETYFSSPLKLAEFVSHAVLSIPAIIFGVWLVALWRPKSTSFPAKSKRIAEVAAILWVLSYVVGVLGFIADYTTFFG